MDGRYNREVICIQGGQAGVQLGHAMWELLTVEHNLNSSGARNDIYDLNTSFETFFSSTPNNQYFPRCLVFDSEPTVIDEIRCGYYRRLFHPDSLINGNEDAANNYARGYYTESKRMLTSLVERTRHLIEQCNNFQGFIVQSSTAGGTGSGLLTSLMEYLVIEFAGRTNIQLSLFPGKTLSNCIVQPYNCVLAQEKLLFCSDINIIVDNEGLYSICHNQLDIKRPSFANINRIICPILSGLTAPIRFNGMLHSDLNDLSTNLIPFPRLHFPFVSYSPLMSKDKWEHDHIDTESLTRSLFLKENQFINADLQDGYFMSSAILYRGNCDLSNILKTIRNIKNDRNLHWVDWCPTGFKISHTRQMHVSIPGHGPKDYDKAAMMLSNHNAIIPTLRALQVHFKILLNVKAYLHWYIGEGMEESELHHALFEVQTICNDYRTTVGHFTGSYVSDENLDQSPEVISTLPINLVIKEEKKQANELSEVKSKENKSNEDKSKEDKSKEDKYKEDKYKEDKSKEDESKNDKSKEVIVRKNSNDFSDEGSKREIISESSSKIDHISIAIKVRSTSEYSQNRSQHNSKGIQSSRLKNNSLKHTNDGENLNNLDIHHSGNTASYSLCKVRDEAKTENDNKERYIDYSQSKVSAPSAQTYLGSFANKFDSVNDSVSGSNNVYDEIFGICEKNYIKGNFETFNKKRVLRQSDISSDATSDHFIKRIYQKNKSMFQKIMHMQQYDLRKSPTS